MRALFLILDDIKKKQLQTFCNSEFEYLERIKRIKEVEEEILNFEESEEN